MRSILGIDAAWTATEPSGVALVSESANAWECIALAPSYGAFIGRAEGRPVRWEEMPVGSAPNPAELLSAARKLLGGERPTVVTVDMPLSKCRINGRRPADDEVSRVFGCYKCGTHSPSSKRPGKIGEQLSGGFTVEGYALATRESPRSSLALVEVYPHPALVRLLNLDERSRYKIGKAARYYHNCPDKDERKGLILDEWRKILCALDREIARIDQDFRDCLEHVPPSNPSSSLKRYEDAIDALVCAWVGIRYLRGEAEAYGDHKAAIRVPKEACGAASGIAHQAAGQEA
jgi:predicted RNase H-like nuclease